MTAVRDHPVVETASVVVPAHNEGAVIERCLDALLDTARPGEFEVVVVCNACTDDTADRARRHPGVTVCELAQPGKVGALNLGDRAVTAMPRIYLDADVVLDTASARALVAAVRSGASVAAPQPHLDLHGASPVVRAYFAIWSRLGAVADAGLGSGVYTLSAAARRRFADFPDLVGDDAFIHRSFPATERVVPAGASTTVVPPLTLRALVRRRARIVRGNVDVQAAFGSAPVAGRSWVGVVRSRPQLAPAAAVYLAVNTAGALAARWHRRRPPVWVHDTTSRGPR